MELPHSHLSYIGVFHAYQSVFLHALLQGLLGDVEDAQAQELSLRVDHQVGGRNVGLVGQLRQDLGRKHFVGVVLGVEGEDGGDLGFVLLAADRVGDGLDDLVNFGPLELPGTGEGDLSVLDPFGERLDGLADGLGGLDLLNFLQIRDGPLVLLQMHLDVGAVPIQVGVLELQILLLSRTIGTA